MAKNRIWSQITKSLESSLSESEINTWLSPAQLIELNKDLAVIQVPNKFVANWLNDNCLEEIKHSFYENLKYQPEIYFTYNGIPKINIIKENNFSNLNKFFNNDLTFNNFIIAKNNRFAYSLAWDVVDHPAEAYNPLYLFSETCSGKTHLLNAIGNQTHQYHPSSKVLYIPLDRLSSDFAISKKTQRISRFKEKYKNYQILLIDDIHLITDRQNLQKELISFIDHYHESKKQLVFAGKASPGKIRNLMPELRSRLEWGILSELQAPDHKTRMKIIKKKADDAKIIIPDDAAFFLANITSDLGILNNHLVKLGAFASLNQTEIDISTIKSVINNRPPYELNVYDVQKLTAQYFNISLTDLLSGKKTHQFSYPRHMAMYLSRELIGLSFKEIAKYFGNKDHSTIIYAVKKVKKDKEIKKTTTNDLLKLQDLLTKGVLK